MSTWGSAPVTDPGMLTPWDELRMILAEHCSHPGQRQRGLQLLQVLRQSGDLSNGDIAGGFGHEGGLVPNGGLGGVWGSGGGAAGPSSWGKGLGGIGTWGGDGLGAGGARWDLGLGPRVGSGSGSGSGLVVEDEASAVLSGLALDGPPPQGLGGWAPNPVASFELDPTPAHGDSRLGAFFMPPSSGVGPPQVPVPPKPAPPQAPPPQPVAEPGPTGAAKFSSVVGGTAKAPPPPKPVEQRGPPQKSGQPSKLDAKRPEPKRIDAANSAAAKGGATSKVKLRGLPYGATPVDVVNFFKGFGVVESQVQFGYNSDGRPSGEAWISFSRLDDARRAVREKDRHHMGDRYVELFLLNEGGGVASRGYK